jgi:hypothetical protein
MTPELQILLGSIVGGTGALLSYWAGWRARGSQRPPRGSYGNCVPLPPAPPYRRDLDPDWRRSLKEQALTALHAVATGSNDTREQHQDLDTIRRALEALND